MKLIVEDFEFVYYMVLLVLLVDNVEEKEVWCLYWYNEVGCLV